MKKKIAKISLLLMMVYVFLGPLVNIWADNSPRGETAKNESDEVTITFEFGDIIPDNGFPSSANILKGSEFDGFVYDEDNNRLPNPMSGSHNFAGWYKSTNFDDPNEMITAKKPLTVNSDVMVYAKWSLKQHTVSFDLDGGEDSVEWDPKKIDHGLPFILKENVYPTKEGSTFRGWSYTKDREGIIEVEKYDLPHKIENITSSLIIRAMWEKNSHTVTFNLNLDYTNGNNLEGNMEFLTPKSVEHGADFRISNNVPINPDGGLFLGWTKGIGNTDLFQAGDVIEKVTGNFTLNANWGVKDDLYSLRFNLEDKDVILSNGNDVFREKRVPEGAVFDGEKITYISGGTPITIDVIKPESESHTFEGWYKDSSFNAEITPDTPGSEVTISTHTTVYAKWEIKKYTVDFKLCGGEVPEGEDESVFDTQEDVVEHGGPFTIPDVTPTRDHYTFDGWYYSDGNISQPAEGRVINNIISDVTVYAFWRINEYTITFDLAGVELNNEFPENIKLEALSEFDGTVYDENDEPLLDPEGKYHDFVGWLYEEDGEEIITPGALLIIEHDIVLHAKWDYNYVKISFDLGEISPNDGFPKSTSVLKGSKFNGTVYDGDGNRLSNPKSDSHDFKGWYKKDDSGNLVPIKEFEVIKDVTLYAKWDIKKYTMTFELAGGEEVTEGDFVKQTVDHGNNFVVPDVEPFREDAEFSHWSSNVSERKYHPNDTIPATQNIILTAEWTLTGDQVIVSFNLDGGEKHELLVDSPVGSDGLFEIPDVTPIKIGSKFSGWTPDGGNITYEKGETIEVNVSMELTAIWTSVDDHWVTLFVNDGTDEVFGVERVMHNNSFNIPKGTPFREGYEFLGWQLNDTVGPLLAPGQQIVRITGDQNLCAIWKAKGLIITFDLAGGEGDFLLEHDRVAGVDFEIPLEFVPTRGSNAFLGWLRGDTGEVLQPGAMLENVVRNTTLTAQWGHTITFNFGEEGYDEDGIFIDTNVEDEGTFIIPEGKPKNPGHIFMGWYYILDEQEIKVVDRTIVNIISNITIYAKWLNEEDATTIVFDLNDGDENAIFVDVVFEIGGTFTIPNVIPEREGYTFDGWLVMPINELLGPDDKFTVEAGTVLTAQWTIKEYNIMFDLRGGSDLEGVFTPQKREHGLPFEVPEDTPSYEGHIFRGWYYLDGGMSTHVQPGGIIEAVKNDITLYANWLDENYALKVTFDLDGGKENAAFNDTVIERYGNFAIPSDIPKKQGYKFEGWSSPDYGDSLQPGTLLTRVERDIILKAKWEELTTYTVNFSGGKGIRPEGIINFPNDPVVVPVGTTFDGKTFVEFEFDDDISFTPSSVSHKFVGWFTTLDYQSEKISSTNLFTVEQDVTLYAKWEINEYTVGFNLNGGGSPSDAPEDTFAEGTVNHGDTFVVPDIEPVRGNDIFKGWSVRVALITTSSEYVQAGESIPYVISNLILVAVWQEVEVDAYTITFELNGGEWSEPETGTVVAGADFIIPTALPTKAGYQFAGWYDNSEFTGGPIGTPGVPTAPILVNSDLTFYAKWEKVYMVDFELNNGTWSEAETFPVVAGESFTIPAEIPTKAGYQFAGWYADSEFTGGPISTPGVPTAPILVNSDLTFYAKWEKVYIVDFELNNGTWSEAETFLVVAGESFTIPAEIPTKAGYQFAGWYADSEFTGGPISTPGVPTAPILVNSDLTFYAKWEKVYTVDFELNGGAWSEAETFPVVAGESFTIPAEIPTKAGYQFAGWYADSEFTGGPISIPVVPTAPILINSNLTYYAKWEKIEEVDTYMIIFELNGGTGAEFATTTVAAGESFTIPTALPTKAGYQFVGWYDNSEFTGNPVSIPGVSSAPILVNSNLTFYAKWEKIEEVDTYTITFELNGGTGSEFADVTVNAGDNFTVPTVEPTKSGYNFLGWYLDKNLTDKAPATLTNINANITLYAKWNEIPDEITSYTVAFELNGGTGNFATMTVNAGDSFTVPTAEPTRSGYNFLGWYLDKNLTDKAPTTITNINANITLYAKWEKVNPDPGVVKYTVSFDLNGGTGDFANIVVAKGTSIMKPTAVPTKAGYTFVGWFTARDGGKEISFPLTVAADTVLYAQWKEIENDANNGTTLGNKPTTGDTSSTTQSLFLVLFAFSLTTVFGISAYKRVKQNSLQ